MRMKWKKLNEQLQIHKQMNSRGQQSQRALQMQSFQRQKLLSQLQEANLTDSSLMYASGSITQPPTIATESGSAMTNSDKDNPHKSMTPEVLYQWVMVRVIHLTIKDGHDHLVYNILKHQTFFASYHPNNSLKRTSSKESMNMNMNMNALNIVGPQASATLLGSPEFLSARPINTPNVMEPTTFLQSVASQTRNTSHDSRHVISDNEQQQPFQITKTCIN